MCTVCGVKTPVGHQPHFLPQEQELYQKEGLGLTEVRYTDNQDCIGECKGQTPDIVWVRDHHLEKLSFNDV